MGAGATEEQHEAPRPESRSVPRPPPEFYRGLDGHIHRRPPSLYQRLRLLRRKAEGAKHTVILLLMLFVAGPAIEAGVMIYSRYGWSADPVELWLTALALLVPLSILVLAYYGARAVANRAFLRSHASCRETLRYTQLAMMVSDEQYWHQLFELQRESPWLKWAQVTPPQTLEQHLEFAAAYHAALLQLAGRPEPLNSNTVTRGNFSWHAGRPTCYVCGVLAAYGCSIFALVYDWAALSGMLAKGGRLAALCDYFLGDFEMLPPEQRAAESARGQIYRDSLALRRGLPAVAALEEYQRTAEYRTRFPLPPSEYTFADAMRDAALRSTKSSDPPEAAPRREAAPSDEAAAE